MLNFAAGEFHRLFSPGTPINTKILFLCRLGRPQSHRQCLGNLAVIRITRKPFRNIDFQAHLRPIGSESWGQGPLSFVVHNTNWRFVLTPLPHKGKTPRCWECPLLMPCLRKSCRAGLHCPDNKSPAHVPLGYGIQWPLMLLF